MSLKFVSCCDKMQFTPRLCNKYFKICYKLEVVTSGHGHCTQILLVVPFERLRTHLVLSDKHCLYLVMCLAMALFYR